MCLQLLLKSSLYLSQTGQASEDKQVPDCWRRGSLASTSCICHTPLKLPHALCLSVRAALLTGWLWRCSPQVEPDARGRQILQHMGRPMRQRDKLTPPPPSLCLATKPASLCDTGALYALLKTLFLKRLLAHYSATAVSCLDTQNVHFSSKECAQPGSSLKLGILWKGWNGHIL